MALPLYVDEVYFYEKDNANVHHTNNYELVHLDPPTPVLRRGQFFNIVLRFSRDYMSDTDIIRLIFDFGQNPNHLSGTRGIVLITDRDSDANDPHQWTARTMSVNGPDLAVEVRSPVDSPVGLWNLKVHITDVTRSRPTYTYTYDNDIYLLFNPWVKEDLVYMQNERLLDEYILNDVGKIWIGAWGSSRGREWVFGQFDASVLKSCELLLERSGIKDSSRGDPIELSRAISRIINSNDDNGVVYGSWDGVYSDGTAPAAWTGSVPILEQFLETGEPVKYGQCWVFAGVVTTVCRALGIPSRVVSNLVSAHDTNASLSVDFYYKMDEEGLRYDDTDIKNSDSIWNYHVWNDVWMARPDLPKGYGGWQAIDATPQEQSSGFYQCGPASVEAIRQGIVGFNYDVPFLLASVNADLMKWVNDPNGVSFKKISFHKYHIGRTILTKAPWTYDPNGDRDKEDITLQYKPKEGTKAERSSLYRAVRSIQNARLNYFTRGETQEDVAFDLKDITRIKIGQEFEVVVHAKNKSNENRTVQAALSAYSVFYTGIKAHTVKGMSEVFVLKPHAEKELKLKVTVDEYLDKLVEYCNMKLRGVASVEETKQVWAEEDDFEILKPSIVVKIDGDPIVGMPVIISLGFKNPLKRTLTDCKFNFVAPGLCKNQTLKFRDIGPEEDVYAEHQLILQKSGSQKIIATFTSKELVDVTGSAAIDVLDTDE